uniref:Uncharacterized protein n=1 Tax=Oryza barthii TaxID=65489 RepID=A0A0D3G7P1_9ORYZ
MAAAAIAVATILHLGWFPCTGKLRRGQPEVESPGGASAVEGGKWRDLEIQHGMSSGVNHVRNLWTSDVDRFGLLKNVILYSCELTRGGSECDRTSTYASSLETNLGALAH